MEWIDRMNIVTDYVESHLCDDISPAEISKIMACPYSVFQRSFVQITGITLSEYIRRRKLTCAAQDIQNTKQKIIDIAVKYGYDSSDAFSVAFKRMHGIGPIMARKQDTELKFHSHLRFTLTIMGVEDMNYKRIDKEPFKVLGIRCTTPTGGGTWEIVKTDGSAEKMKQICGHACNLGLCFGFNEDGSNDYMCGIEYNGSDVQGFDSFTYSKTTWLVFEAQGTISSGVLGSTWRRIYGEFLPQSGYKQNELPTIENYVLWDEKEDSCKVEIMIPIES